MTPEERIIESVRAVLPEGVEVAELTPELRLREDLHMESLTLVSVMIQLEEEFGFSLDDLEIDLTGIETVRDVVSKGLEALSLAGVVDLE